MSSPHSASLLRVTLGLMLAQSLALAAHSTAVTVNTLAAVQLSGQKALAGLAGNLLGTLNFIFKCFLGVVCMIWLRWTLPRLRVDQVMSLCLKYFIPLATVMLAGCMLWQYAMPDGMLRSVGIGQREATCADRQSSSSALQDELFLPDNPLRHLTGRHEPPVSNSEVPDVSLRQTATRQQATILRTSPRTP